MSSTAALPACVDAWECLHVASLPTSPYLRERGDLARTFGVVAFPGCSERHRRALARARAEQPGKAREVQLRERLARQWRHGRRAA